MNVNSAPDSWGPGAKKATTWLIGLSGVLILTGVAAIAMPGISTLAFTLILGWLLLFNGIVRVIKSFRSKLIRGFWFSLLVGMLYGITGLYVVFHPVAAVVTLTWVLGFLLIVEGIITLVTAFVNKTGRHLSWMVVLDGVITLILGILVLNQWPFSAVWLIGLYIGLSILISGISLLAISVATRHALSQSA